MDIWEKLYEAAKNDYNPHYVTPFIYSNHVVAAIEAEDGFSQATVLKLRLVYFIFVRNELLHLICSSNLVKRL